MKAMILPIYLSSFLKKKIYLANFFVTVIHGHRHYMLTVNSYCINPSVLNGHSFF